MGVIPLSLAKVIHNFFQSYGEAAQENGSSLQDVQSILEKYVDLIVEQLQYPYPFEPYHHRVIKPFDYYHYGLDLLRPLVVFEKSKVLGLQRVKEMEQVLAQRENVVLLANHQTEPDPQAISLLLEKTYPQLAEEMIAVAGHRVISDPLAAPISKGRNLICVFSKRHLENPPEKKQEKVRHNQLAMRKLTELLKEGGKCIYVAPSGGRDRPNAHGEIEVAKFDPQSIEMFWLIAQQSGRPCHFYPLALATYDLLPPPNSIEKDLGEERHARCTPIHMAFGAEIDMLNFPGSDQVDKKVRRQVRAEYIWEQVFNDYQKLRSLQ
ncbi:MAG: 1-acyl-sn-glycerol-3-phosphate acyltransferase [Parachlamydiaceae bacterium]|nr:1-acyl-sn-glycerol-3-phosphate acyltransferase [Parachlamydiaceae bacterium]